MKTNLMLLCVNTVTRNQTTFNTHFKRDTAGLTIFTRSGNGLMCVIVNGWDIDRMYHELLLNIQ